MLILVIPAFISLQHRDSWRWSSCDYGLTVMVWLSWLDCGGLCLLQKNEQQALPAWHRPRGSQPVTWWLLNCWHPMVLERHRDLDQLWDFTVQGSTDKKEGGSWGVCVCVGGVCMVTVIAWAKPLMDVTIMHRNKLFQQFLRTHLFTPFLSTIITF